MAQIKLYEQPSFDEQAGPSEAPRKQWQSLEELDNPEEFAHFLERYPRQAAIFHQSKLNRRTFLQLSGAALAMMLLAGLGSLVWFGRLP